MTKKENYSAAQVAKLEEVYNPKASQDERDAQILQLESELGKSVQSLRGKLAKMGIYVKRATKSTVTAMEPAKKEDMAKTLQTVTGLPLVGIEKANKTAISELITLAKAYNDLCALVSENVEFVSDDAEETENAETE